MTEQRSVGIVILGAGGYMGKNGIHALKFLVDKLSKSNINLHFLCLAEPKDAYRNTAIELCNSCITHPLIPANWLSEALLHLESARGRERYPILIYDATPTTFHHGNLIAVHQRQDDSLFYLGEKPIFTDLYEMQPFVRNIDEGFEFFCELIETENPVFLAINEYLKSNTDKLQIKEIWLWRAGCSGIKKAISISRDGVEGGALEDKSLHDLSISAGLLGRSNINDAVVTNAEIHALILHRDYFFENGDKVFLNVCNHATKEIVVDMDQEDLLPADGLLSMDVTWKLKDRDVPSKYLFSWLGFNEQPKELEFTAELIKLGFPLNPTEAEFPDLNEKPRKWLDISTPFESVRGSEKYQAKMQEIRVGIIRLESDSNEKYIVCNFLSKYNSRRFAYLVEIQRGHPVITETLFMDGVEESTYEQKKGEDLSKILHNVIKHALGEEEAEFIDRETTLLLHKIMINARRQAFENFPADTDYWFSIAKDIFAKNIARTTLD